MTVPIVEAWIGGTRRNKSKDKRWFDKALADYRRCCERMKKQTNGLTIRHATR